MRRAPEGRTAPRGSLVVALYFNLTVLGYRGLKTYDGTETKTKVIVTIQGIESFDRHAGSYPLKWRKVCCKRNPLIVMARKRNPENDLVTSSAAATRPRRTTTAARPAARPKHSPTTADTPEASELKSEVEASSAASSISGSSNELGPSHEEVRALAHSYWLARGCQGGSPEEDWRRAEEELRALVTTT